jgi:hypothetical protein
MHVGLIVRAGLVGSLSLPLVFAQPALPSLDFEDGLRGWSADGDAFNEQPVLAAAAAPRATRPSHGEGLGQIQIALGLDSD